jgi:PAS domain S-box-containing protein
MGDGLDALPCGVLELDDDGIILDVNRSLAEMLGRSRDELSGQRIDVVFPPGGKIFYQTHFFPLLKMYGTIEEVYFELLTAAGERIPVLINAARTEEAGRGSTVSVLVRVSQRARYEEAILEARRKAEAASQAKEKFLSMMSHDLRTPLQTIAVVAEVLLRGGRGPLSEAQRKEVETLRAASGDLSRLIDDVLGFSMLESGRVKVTLGQVPVAEAMRRAITLTRLRIEEAGLEVEVGQVDEAATVRADPDRLQQVLLNLITNAVKFTPPGGSISISYGREGERGRIAVRDTGEGIEHEDLEAIFEPFVQVRPERTPPPHRGVGLGLAISRDLVRAMGGDLTVESAPGEGSRFTIELAVEEAGPGRDEGSAPSRSPMRPRPRPET